ncbi:MAG: hypothetical protein JO161_08195 [Planctomycetaceae bacterium]|nr:hypothetical protein [Planctomycetaceae bacterium]
MQTADDLVVNPPPDLPLWRQALAVVMMMTGVVVVCVATFADIVSSSWVFFVGGIVGGVLCWVLGGVVVAQRITCGRCGRSIVSVGGRPGKCPIKNCLHCGAPFFSDRTGAPR